MNRKKRKIISNEAFFSEARQFLDEGKSVSFYVKGESMSPFLKDGDRIVVKSLNKDKLKNGMIILAYTSEGYILHRLVNIKEESVTLAGDGNLSQEENARYSDVLGIAIAAFRGEKELSINTQLNRFAGILWYKIRIFRKIIYRIAKVR